MPRSQTAAVKISKNAIHQAPSSVYTCYIWYI